MREIVVISGKGGTGKTVLTGSFAALAKNKVMVDCDVDAADLHLLLHPDIKECHEFKSGKTAHLNKKICNTCGKCIAVCRFGAVKDDFTIDPISCEGCGLCGRVCPAGAIIMRDNIAGEWFISDTKYGPFVHAKLGIAEENSGKLVAKVKQIAKDLARERGMDYIIVDGPPGIGCPVIASLAGADCALIVTEPTLSGLHDAARVAEVAEHFKVPVKLVVNKYDLNDEMTADIEKFCGKRNIPVIGRIGFDKSVVESMVAGKLIVEHAAGKIKEEIINIWKELK